MPPMLLRGRHRNTVFSLWSMCHGVALHLTAHQLDIAVVFRCCSGIEVLDAGAHSRDASKESSAVNVQCGFVQEGRERMWCSNASQLFEEEFNLEFRRFCDIEF